MKGIPLSVNLDHNHEPSNVVDETSTILITKINQKGRRRRHKRKMRESPLQFLSETEFVKIFRLDKETVKMVAEDLTPHIQMERRKDGISIMTKILAALAFLATGKYQSVVGQNTIHNVSQPTVSRSVRQVLAAINKVYSKYVSWPSQEKDRNRIKDEFYKKFGIPGVLGCIDSTHVAIIRPQHQQQLFCNSKGFHSLNVMIVCDANLNLLCVDTSIPGSTQDSDAWQSHPLSSHLTELTNNGDQVFLLGNSKYSLRKTIMTPILNTVDGTPEHHYETKHATARNTTERCIAVLKSRFRCLRLARFLRYDPVMAGNIVSACAVLHNIANANNAPVPPLSPMEANYESFHQQQIAEEFKDSAKMLKCAPENNEENPSPELIAGETVQQALVTKLWMEKNENL